MNLADAIARAAHFGRTMSGPDITAFSDKWKADHPFTPPTMPSIPTRPSLPLQPIDISKYIPAGVSTGLPDNFDPMTYRPSIPFGAPITGGTTGGFSDLGHHNNRHGIDISKYIPARPF